jgi:HlyD family secretion protein
MDIARPEERRKKKVRRVVYISVALLVVVGITVALSRLKPAPPGVDHSTIWTDRVKRGPMVRDVEGLGTLVPVDIRWIPAQTSARVDKILLQSGAIVKQDSVILELSDPQLEHDALDAEYAYKAAESDFANLKVQLASSLMAQKSAAADVENLYQQATLQADLDKQLSDRGMQATVISKKSTVAAEELGKKEGLVQQQLKIAGDAAQAQIAAAESHLQQQRVLYELKKQQLEALHVRAGLRGMLSAVPVEVGQQVAPGTNLVRVVDPTHLKATIQIPETQAKDIQIGQLASIDTHNGIVNGHVTRIDAAVVNGTVAVDVSVDGPLPPGGRPYLSVDGTIELERLLNVLYVGRPVRVQPNSTVGLFKLVAGGKEAVRLKVQLGRSSVNSIEVVQGLEAGDQVILSDMSVWSTYDRVRLE